MSHPKILILVLSYNEPPYSDLMKAQQETFDSIEVEGVRTVYYSGGNADLVLMVNTTSRSVDLRFDITDEYYRMAGKLQRTLEEIKDWDYNIIFRTNSSSYCHKQRLKNFAETLPTEKLYAGWTFHDSNSEDKGMTVSGAGIWLTRDCADILRTQINPDTELEEDVYISRILRKNGIEAIDDKIRVDIGEVVEAYPPKVYHYKLKNGDRLQDAANFYKLHEKVK